jgi:hypothetical protein
MRMATDEDATWIDLNSDAGSSGGKTDACERFIKWAQSVARENIGPEGTLPCRKAPRSVNSPTRSSKKPNNNSSRGRIGRPSARASGGADGTGIQPSLGSKSLEELTRAVCNLSRPRLVLPNSKPKREFDVGHHCKVD